MRSIKQRLVILIGLLVVFICVFLDISADRGARQALKHSVESSMLQTANQAAGSIKGMSGGKITQLEVAAARSEIVKSDVPMEEKNRVLKEEAEITNCGGYTLLDKEGNVIAGVDRGIDYASRDYFKKALDGESSMSDPIVIGNSGMVLTVCAAPVKENGKITGVLLRAGDANELSDITNRIKYGENGIAYMINKDGRVIAHPDREAVLSMKNAIDVAETDDSYKGLAEALKKAVKEKSGVNTYKFKGVKQYMAYAPIPDTDWIVVIDVPAKELLSEIKSLSYKNIIISICFIICGLIAAYRVSVNISEGITESSNVLGALAEGDLRIKISDRYLNNKDEIGDMTRAMKSMSQSLSTMIKDVKSNSLSIESESENLSIAAKEVNDVSKIVAEAIIEIAKGTNSQSGELMDISKTLNEFGNNINKVVTEIRDVDRESKVINEKANTSSDEMIHLTESVANVGNVFKAFSQKIDVFSKNVNEIDEITNVINGIAGQTNLLALNAAIEAARAGEAGKGFAVVADEIRNLAEQSKVSAEKISRLILGISEEARNTVKESSIMDSELSKQDEVIRKTMESFNSIIESINEVIPKINTVEKSVHKLNEEKDDILSKVENVSSVSINVSASAEQISASSEEMNASIEGVVGIAQSLKDMTKEMMDDVNEFKVAD